MGTRLGTKSVQLYENSGADDMSQVSPNTDGMERILRLPEVISVSGLSRSTLYAQIQQGLWPKPIRLGSRAVGWVASEAQALISARIAGKDSDKIRQLVLQLETSRNQQIGRAHV